MKIYIFGTCAGTEPMKNRHHTSIAIEISGKVYWFDAGENCSYTAHLMGVDLLSVSDIFISHAHIDHIGGLENLLFNIYKLSNVKNTIPVYGDITVHMPNEKSFGGIMTVLENAETGYNKRYQTISKRITDSVIMIDDNISVEAIHNNHLPESDEGWQSFSFLIKAENKKIVYSGDIKHLNDIEPFIKEGCDALFIETGHHSAESLCHEIVNRCYDIKNIYFMHHGRKILNDYEGELKKCRKIIPEVIFCNDKDIFTI